MRVRLGPAPLRVHVRLLLGAPVKLAIRVLGSRAWGLRLKGFGFAMLGF